MDRQRMCWRKDLIEAIFCPGTTVKILALPLRRSGKEDMLYWPETEYWDYMCKSDYRFVTAQLEQNETPSSYAVALSSSLWKKLWISPAFPRCKEVAWRSIMGILTVRLLLHHRHLDIDSTCVVCDVDMESFEHFLLRCPASVAF